MLRDNPVFKLLAQESNKQIQSAIEPKSSSSNEKKDQTSNHIESLELVNNDNRRMSEPNILIRDNFNLDSNLNDSANFIKTITGMPFIL